MARISFSTTTTDIRHTDKRLYNPPAAIAGAVPLAPRYEYSAHRVPELRFYAEDEILTDAAQLPDLEKLPPAGHTALLNLSK